MEPAAIRTWRSREMVLYLAVEGDGLLPANDRKAGFFPCEDTAVDVYDVYTGVVKELETCLLAPVAGTAHYVYGPLTFGEGGCV